MNKKILKTILVIILINLVVYCEAFEFNFSNVRLTVSEKEPVIEKIIVISEETEELIAERLEFMVLKNKDFEITKELFKNYKISKKDNTLIYKTEDKNLNLNQKIYFNENNSFKTEIKIVSLNENVDLSDYYFELNPGLCSENLRGYGNAVTYMTMDENDIESFKSGKNTKTDNVPSSKWVAFTNQYYAIAIFNNNFSDINIANFQGKEEDKYLQRIKMTLPSKVLANGSIYEDEYKGYIGEKRLEKLEENNLSELLDLGFFGAIAKGFLILLKKMNTFTHNWGLSIMLLTLFIRIVLYPLNLKQAKSMADMQKLQPEIEALKKKYGKDSQKLNVEMMELYKKHNVNPFGGCLPILIQIPILFALFTMLRTSIEIKGASFFWLFDLSKPDPMYILPVLIAVSMYFQQKMTTISSPQQKQMMVMMPAIMLIITINLPSGVLLYWFVSNIVSIFQQMVVNKHVYGGKEKK